jgi:hypothetical protein
MAAPTSSTLHTSHGDGPLDEAGAQALREAFAKAQTTQSTLEVELRTLRATNDDNAGEIARLKSALAVYENANGDEKAAGRESRIALKAKLTASLNQSAQQAEVIQRLRTELASVNERLALQASHFRDELRRQGAGTLPTSAAARRVPVTPAKLSIAERVADVLSPAREGSEPAKPEPVAAVATPSRPDPSTNGDGTPRIAEASVAGMISTANAGDDDDTTSVDGKRRKAAAIGRHTSEAPVGEAVAATSAGDEPASKPSAQASRPRLLDRISNLAKAP